MRRKTLLCLASLIVVVKTQLVPNHVSLNEKRKHIEVDSSWLDKKQKEVQRVALDASNKEKVVLDLLNTNQRFSASSAGNVAAAETFDGKRAQVQKIGDKGGIATVDGHKAQLRTKTDGEGEHALLKADGKYELDTIAKGDLKGDPSKTEFEAKNERLDFKLNPHSHNNNSGDGTLSFYDKEKDKNGKYAYTISQNGKKTDATLSADNLIGSELEQSLFGRRNNKYHCTAETPGVSQCYDAKGHSVGKVVADKNGNTVVYNDKDVPIGTGSVKQTGPRSYEAVISKNLFIAKLKDVRSAPCCKELTGQECTQPIKLANPTFNHPSQREGDGTVHLTWPDCFDMGIDITLPPGVHINKLAMKLDVSIQPIGKLRCMDVATCGRECFYCDWCKESRKLKLLENTEGNLCRATGERTYRLTTKLCPPPEDPNFTMCTAFSKSVWQKDYWQKQGAVDVWMKFYERGQTRPELEKEFFAQIDNPLLGKAFKFAIIGEWLAANSLDQGSYTPTNSELLEYWVSKRDPDRLLACQHAVVDYDIEGAKVKTNLLFEAATTANSIPNILKDKKCGAFEKLQEDRFQKEAADYKKTSGGGNFLSGLGGFLNTVRG
ncbi:CBN-TAG-297 protein [Caenorhabditis brenneri]|uniref:CBN-TAG-297 protein n=1 Tax=Caenorhabditis brenneri TaxID=135651 RepID=G0N702_CAEBE|nr:CBN-TAG-297 protein [Caenorhabditis brenneri]